jgi:hypothetical protein
MADSKTTTPFIWRNWVVSFDGDYAENLCQAIHIHYDGAPIDSFGPPADNRFVWGPDWPTVRQQIIELEESE